MSLQTAITYLIVSLAGMYLLRMLLLGVRAFLSKHEGGCATGCGKCAFGPLEKKGARSSRSVIPTGDIRPMVGQSSPTVRGDDSRAGAGRD